MNKLFFDKHQPVPRPLRASLWDVAFYSLMVGLGETYLSAFVLTMGFSERASGLMVTIPTLIGAVIQLAAGFCAQLLGSQKTWVMISASIQGLSLLLLGILSLGVSTAPLPRETAVFLLITSYWTFGLAAGPSWSSWIGSIVPNDCRTQFFAYRTRIAQLFTVLGLIAAGFALETESLAKQKLPIFALLFSIGALCRFISVSFLQRHPESLVEPRIESTALFKREFWQWFAARRTLTIIAFLFLTQIAVYISGPFFNAYLLKQLSLDYHDYMLLISTAFIARVVAGGVFQRLALHLGSTTLTHLGALLIVPLPLFWITTQSLPWLVVFQTLTGFAWGCHELGVTLLTMDKQSHIERSRLLTITQLLNSSAMFLGSWIGYVLLGSGTPTASAYYLIFVVSSCMRLIPVLILPFLGDSRLHRLLNISAADQPAPAPPAASTSGERRRKAR